MKEPPKKDNMLNIGKLAFIALRMLLRTSIFAMRKFMSKIANHSILKNIPIVLPIMKSAILPN